MSTPLKQLLLAVVLCCTACNSTQVGSKFVKTQQVSATQGGTLTVVASDSPELAGAKLEIEPGALSGDTEITLELGPGAITQGGDKSAGYLAIWRPSGTKFNKAVMMTLPYELQPGETIDRLFIQVEEEDGTRFMVDRSIITIDEQAHVMRFPVHGFTGFQPGTNTPCMANNDCAMGQVCVNGVCKATGCGAMNGGCQCQSNSECAAGQVCSNGLCQACTTNSCTGACSNINQCPMGQACLNGQCTVCTAMSCNSSCSNSNPCPNGAVCLNGVCQQPACGQNAPCPSGQVCNNAGVCVPNSNGCGTMGGTTCPSGQLCVNGQCTPTMGQCGPNAPCPQGQTCSTNGTCQSCTGMNCPVCDASRPCLQGQVCVNGTCQSCSNGACAACMTNTDCPAGQACVQGQCRVTMSQCGPNAPCPSGQVCNSNGSCQASNACNGTMGCPNGQTCQNGVCHGNADGGSSGGDGGTNTPDGGSNGGNDGGTNGGDGGTSNNPDGGNGTGDAGMSGGNDGGSSNGDAGVPRCGDAGTVCVGGQICFNGFCQQVACGMGQTCPTPYTCQQNFCR